MHCTNACPRIREAQHHLNEGAVAAQIYAELIRIGYSREAAKEVMQIAGEVVRERIQKIIYL